MIQVWRKISRSLLMILGTLSLLIVATGLSADLPRAPALTLTTPIHHEMEEPGLDTNHVEKIPPQTKDRSKGWNKPLPLEKSILNG